MASPEVTFEAPVVIGRLVRRYKRFFMDVHLEDKDEVVVAHTPNTGSMKGLLGDGNRVMMTYNPSPKRKLDYSVQAIEVGESWVGCNTHLPNKFVAAVIAAQKIPELTGYQTIRKEVKYGLENRSRIDLLLEDHKEGAPSCYVEVKNVTLKEGSGALFPDAVTTRGQKHIEELMGVMAQGHRAALVFLVQRLDCAHFAPADEIDVQYGQLLRKAEKSGLCVLPLVARVEKSGVGFAGALPYEL
jgi:sugar fermentation stimulation protein A